MWEIFQFPKGMKSFLFSYTVETGYDIHPSMYVIGTRALFPEGKSAKL
jgi:hypothetical protein